jgi:hypothetical protein
LTVFANSSCFACGTLLSIRNWCRMTKTLGCLSNFASNNNSETRCAWSVAHNIESHSVPLAPRRQVFPIVVKISLTHAKKQASGCYYPNFCSTSWAVRSTPSSIVRDHSRTGSPDSGTRRLLSEHFWWETRRSKMTFVLLLGPRSSWVGNERRPDLSVVQGFVCQNPSLYQSLNCGHQWGFSQCLCFLWHLIFSLLLKRNDCNGMLHSRIITY